MMKMTVKTRQISHLSFEIAVLAVCLTFGACSWIPKGETGLDVGIKDRGIASWYGEQFHGKQAANGEIFDMAAMTAAHRTLPLGSMVRVVNLTNGKHVRVRINDRGPYVNGRILDLSHAAAAQLGMVEGGLSVIQLEVIGDHRPDFVVAAEEAMPSASVQLAFRQLDQQEPAPASFRVPVPADPTMAQVHRLAPTDILFLRRLRRVSGVLADDHTAHAEIAALVLD